MGKGIGMKVATCVATGSTIQAADAAKSDAPFKCAKCIASVELVAGHWINKPDPDLARHVEALFRLCKGKQNEHEQNCSNTAKGQVEEIVRQSKSVEDSRDPFSKRDADGTYVFRINIPTEESAWPPNKLDTPQPAKEDWKARKERTWSGQWMSRFCRSAVGLAKLWQALESRSGQAELSRIVRIELNGKRVPWKRFFFPPENIHEFSELVKKRIDYPVALLLHARRVFKDAQGKPRIDFTATKDVSEQIDTRISINLYGSDKVLSLFNEKKYYVVFGDYKWRGDNSFPKDGPVKRLYKNFALDVYQAAQFEQVDVSDIELED